MLMRYLIVAALLLVPGAAALTELDQDTEVRPDSQAAEPAVPWGFTLGGTGMALGALAFMVGGLRHVDRQNVLEHPLRRQLLDAVIAEPGIHLRQLAARFGTAVTNTQWHLRKLEMAGLVKTEKSGGRRLYYPVAGGQVARQEALRHASITNPNAERLVQHLSENPGMTPTQLAESTMINPGTVRWHLRKLEATGLVRSVAEGAEPAYYLEEGPGAARPPRPARETRTRPAPTPRQRTPATPQQPPEGTEQKGRGL